MELKPSEFFAQYLGSNAELQPHAPGTNMIEHFDIRIRNEESVREVIPKVINDFFTMIRVTYELRSDWYYFSFEGIGYKLWWIHLHDNLVGVIFGFDRD